MSVKVNATDLIWSVITAPCAIYDDKAREEHYKKTISDVVKRTVAAALKPLEAENQRLRKALERIAYHSDDDPLADCAMRQWAREALTQKEG